MLYNFIQFIVCGFCECLSFCVYAIFPFGFEDGMWHLSALVPDLCLFFTFKDDVWRNKKKNKLPEL